MTDTLRVDGELLIASVDDRILTYRLLPYGEPGRTNKGTITAARGVLTLPEDPTQLVANLEHDRKRPAARFVRLEDTPDALLCSVRALNTTAGDDLLAEASERVRTGISVEIDNPVIRDGQLLAGALSGAGCVVSPAFPGAQLVAADAGELPDELAPDSDSTTTTDELIEINGVKYRRVTTSTYTTETTPVSDDTEPTDPPADPAEATTEEPTAMTASAPAGIPGATGTTLTASSDERSLRDVCRLLASEYRDGGDDRLLAALSDIKMTGNGTVGADINVPGWLGELWSGRTYSRKYVPLFTSRSLTSIKLSGWRWLDKPAVAPYAGNKAAVPSNAPTTEPVSVAAQRLAGAHDVDRAYRDFDVAEFWDSYYRAMTDSYAVQSDLQALADAIAVATEITAEGTLAAWTPAASIVDGALAVIDAGGSPTAAVVGKDLYRALLLTPANELVELLSGALGIDKGEAAGFQIVPSSDADLTGKALVLDRGGFVFGELPGVPIRVEAINQANGGIDPGVYGYFADYETDPSLLQLVSKPGA